MTRLALFGLLLFAATLHSAPVPKEVRAKPSHVGKWQNVYVDNKNPTVITSRGQFWYFDDAGSFTYQNANEAGPPPKLVERMVFDPKTGHMEHSMSAADDKVRLGVYKIEGGRLTINLNGGAGTPRPQGLEPEANSNIWHLQRIEEKK